MEVLCLRFALTSKRKAAPVDIMKYKIKLNYYIDHLKKKEEEHCLLLAMGNAVV